MRWRKADAARQRAEVIDLRERLAPYVDATADELEHPVPVIPDAVMEPVGASRPYRPRHLAP